jgi:hypothetical protein
MVVFNNFVTDAGIAFALGLLGGLAAELIVHKGGIEMPHTGDEKHLISAGFLSNLLLGAVAALAYFFILGDISDPYKFVGAAVGAGVGGSSLLIAVKEKIVGGISQNNLESAGETMEQTASGLERLKSRLGMEPQQKKVLGAEVESAAPELDSIIDSLRKRASKIKSS